MPTFRLAYLALGLLIVLGPLVLADPSQEKPTAMFDVHDQAGGKAVFDRVAELHGRNERIASELIRKSESRSIVAADMKNVGQVNAGLLRQLRAARELVLRGEPAGHDLRARAVQMKNHLDEIVVGLRGFPAAQPAIDKIRKEMTKAAPARAKELKAIEQLVSQQKWPEAEKKLYALYDQLKDRTCFLSPEEQRPIFEPFTPLEGAIERGMERIRLDETNLALSKARDAAAPKYDALLAEIAAATESVRGSGEAEVDGAMVAGPDLIARYTEEWQAVQLAASHCRGLEATRCAAMLTGRTPELEAIEKNLAQFSQLMPEKLAALIAADASRVAEPEVRALYARYLTVCAALVNQAADDRLTKAIEPPLQQLALRSKELASQVESYRASTSQLLLWRKRLASSMASARESHYPGALARTANIASNLSQSSQAVPLELGTKTAPDWAAAASALLNKTNLQAGLAFPMKNGKYTLSAYQGRSWVRVAGQPDFAGELTRLRRELMAEAQTPLTLEAAVALDGANSGRCVAFGGVVTGFSIEALVTRFTMLPPAAVSLFPFGPFAPESLGSNFTASEATPLRQLILRYELQPHWFQNAYFFVEVQPGG